MNKKVTGQIKFLPMKYTSHKTLNLNLCKRQILGAHRAKPSVRPRIRCKEF